MTKRIYFETPRDVAPWLGGVVEWFTPEQFAGLVAHVWNGADSEPSGVAFVDGAKLDSLIAGYIRDELELDPTDFGFAADQ